MGFPWNFEETFEGGTKGNFDSESDTGNRLSRVARVTPERGIPRCLPRATRRTEPNG
jgi:hypothetical protein